MVDETKELPTPMRSGSPPPFYNMGFKDFEDMCRDLMEKEPTVESCHIYGVTGQSQEGIDLKAHRTDGGIDVGQCKCQENFTTKDIREVTNKFFKHWDYWQDKEIRRFILFIGSDLKKKKGVNEIDNQKEFFEEHGINYEVWQASKIRDMLRPHKGIVRTHLGEDWVRRICSNVESSEHNASTGINNTGSGIVERSLVEKAERVEGFLSEEVEKRLEEFRDLWKEGKWQEAFDWIVELRSSRAKWQSFSQETQAKLIRFQASLVISINKDLDKAKKLADEADELVGNEKQKRLRSIIVHRERGAREAYKYIEDSHDIDSINLKIAYLIDLGEFDQISHILKKEVEEKDFTAETHRLAALFYLSQNDLERAELEIDKGLQIKPNWKDLEFVKGMITYFKSLPPSLSKSCLVNWPEPLDPGYVKADDRSVEYLKRAEEIFTRLIEVEYDDEQKKRLQTWKLASLTMNPSSYQQASDYLRTITDANPTHYQSVLWGIVSGLNFDIERSILKIDKVIEKKEQPLDTNYVVALTACYLQTESFEEAKNTLEKYQEIFDVHVEAEMQWNYWYCQSLVLNGEESQALEKIEKEELEEELGAIKKMALKAEALKTEEWEKLCNFLLKKFRDAKDIRYLLEYCSIKLGQSKWEDIIAFSDQLLDSKISLAIRYAYLSHFNTSSFQGCLKVIKDKLKFLEHTPYESEAKRIKAICKQKLGLLPEAIHDAELMVDRDPSAENLLTLADLYISKGDVGGVIPIAKKLLNKDKVRALDLLKTAARVDIEDKKLAKKLWQNALEKELPDKQVGLAIQLGYKIGLDEQVAKLWKRIDLSKPERYGLQGINYDGLIELIKEDKKKGKEVNSLYEKAVVPIHLITEKNNVTLAEIIYRCFNSSQTEYKPKNIPNLFVRYGGKDLEEVANHIVEAESFLMDASSILIADSLDFLDKIEEEFNPIEISFHLLPSLIEMREKIQGHQPSRIKLRERIVEFCEVDKINIAYTYEKDLKAEDEVIEKMGSNWARIYQLQKSVNGYVLEYFPLTDNNLNLLSADFRQEIIGNVIGQYSLIESLYEVGKINTREKEKYLKALESDARKENPQLISADSPIFARSEMLSSLAHHSILDLVCDTFNISISESDFEGIKSDVQHYNKRVKRIDKWLKALIDRIQEGIESDVYQVLPETDAKESRKNELFSQSAKGLFDLIGQANGSKGIIGCDDRFVNKYFMLNNKVIVTTIDIIYSLRDKGKINKDRYFSILHQLRAANVRFIPFNKNELLYQLEQAKIKNDGRIVETRQLKTIRRYHASSLHNDDILHFPEVEEDEIQSLGEFKFFKTLYNLLDETIFEIWSSDNLSREYKVAYSNWIMNNLYYDHPRKNFLESDQHSSTDLLYGMGTTLGALIYRSSVLLRDEGKLEEYLGWLNKVFLGEKLKKNTGLVEIISDKIKDLFNSFISSTNEVENDSEYTSEQIRVGTQFTFHRFYNHLPSSLKEEIGKDGEFMKRFGYGGVVTVDGNQFKENEYWPSVQRAINGIENEVKPLNTEHKVVLSPLNSSDNIGFKIESKSNSDAIEITDDFHVWALVSSKEERVKLLLNKRELFDFTRERFQEEIEDISSIEDVSERVNSLYSLYESSPSVYYSELEEKIRSREGSKLNELLPGDIKDLKRYFRLSSKEFDLSNLKSCFSLLAEEDGLEKATFRYIGLPVKFSKCISKKILERDKEDIENLIRFLIREPNSPVAFIQLIGILNKIGEVEEKYLRLSNRLVKYLSTEAFQKEFRAFKVLLRWFWQEFQEENKSDELSQDLVLLLAWGHTSKIYSILKKNRVDLDWVIKTFQRKSLKLYHLFSEQRNNQEVSDSRYLTYQKFLAFGLGYSLNSELPNNIKEKLSRVCIFNFPDDKEREEFPHPALFLDVSRANNSIQSFLGEKYESKFNWFLKESLSKHLTHKGISQSVEDAIDYLKEEPLSFFHWAHLYHVFGQFSLPVELQDEIREIINSIEVTNLNLKNITEVLHTLTYVSDFAIKIGNDVLQEHLIQETFKCISFIIGEELDEAEGQRKLVLLSMDVLLKVSRISGSEQEEENKKFNRLVNIVLDKWPDTSSGIRQLYENICNRLPISQSRYFIPTLMRLRAEA